MTDDEHSFAALAAAVGDAVAPAIASARRDHALRRLEENFVGATRPIYTPVRGIPIQIGTCVLLRCGEDAFLVTAAHVIDNCEPDGPFLGNPPDFIPLQGEMIMTRKVKGSRFLDRHDVAVMRLWPDIVARLGADTFVQEDQVDWGLGPHKHHLLTALGYPNSQNKKPRPGRNKIRRSYLQYTNGVCDDPAVLATLPENGGRHIVLRHERQSLDEAGEKVTTFALKGMSGGPVIDLGDMVHAATGPDGNPADPRLAGIFIELPPKIGRIVATRMQVVRALIDESRKAD